MKIKLFLLYAFLASNLVSCYFVEAQINSQYSQTATNVFSIYQNDIYDEIGDEQKRYANYIRYAEKLPELLPSDQDTNGNWGSITNGLQLSLRFLHDKQYTVGGVVPAMIVLRNLQMDSRTILVTNSPSYFLNFIVNSETNRLAEREERILEPSHNNITGSALPSPPQGLQKLNCRAASEKIVVLNLGKNFDFKQPGEYTVQVLCRVYSPETKTPIYEVSSGVTSFHLVEKPPSASGAP